MNTSSTASSRREFLSTATAVCAALVGGNLAGCSEQSPQSPERSRRVRIGYQKSSTILNLLRTRKELAQKLAPRATVEWTEFGGGPQLFEGINVGSIDFGHAGEAPPVFAQAAGVPLIYVGAEPAGPNAEAILVRRDAPMQKVVDLKGKRVAVHRGSNTHYLLVRALESAGLGYGEIETVFLPPPDARAAFESGSVDAWSIWDPFYALAERSGESRVLVDGTGLVDNRGYFFAHREFVAQQPTTLNTLLGELGAIADWANQHREEVSRFLAELTGVDEATFRATEHRRKYGRLAIQPEMIAYQQKMADTFFKLGLIPKPVQVAEAFHTLG